MIVSTNKFDTWIAHRVNWLVQRWSKATGRDNFTLARLMVRLAIIILGITLIAVRHHDIADFAFDLCLIGYWIWFAQSQLRDYAVIECMVERWENGNVDIALREATLMRNICIWRQWYLLSGVFCFLFGIAPQLSIATFIIGIAFLLFGFSGYAALSFNGGGKSVWARAKDKVKEWTRRTADNLSPTPIPVPVRV